MTAVFEQYGLRIQYPENWKLHHHAAESHAIEIQLVAPSGAFWSLMAFGTEHSPARLMQEVLKSISDQYEQTESTPASEVLMGRFNSTGFDTWFFCLDLLITNRMRVVASGEHHLLITWQAENREFDQLELVFQAINTSLLSNLGENNRYNSDSVETN